MMKYLIPTLLMVAFLFSSCHENPNKPAPVDERQLKESLEKTNRYLANDEEEDINNYVARHKLEMCATGTGMRYQILKAGEGDLIKLGQKVTMEYELKNIMGDVIYSSEKDGVKSFVVGHDRVESGLNEAMSYLHNGDVAVIIIPSHLGFGLLGDQKSIPGRATLIYTVKINKVE